MEKREVKRYSLVGYDTKKHEKIHYIVDFNDKNILKLDITKKNPTKNTLPEIDKFTTRFVSREDLFQYMSECDLLPTTNNINLYIDYNYNGPKSTQVIYDGEMNDFAHELSNQVDITTPAFKQLFDKLLISTQYPRYIDFMSQHSFFDSYLYNKLMDYRNRGNMSQDEYNMLLRKIKLSLVSSKTIRDIYIGTNAYKETFYGSKPKSKDDSDFLDETEMVMFDLFLHGGEEELYKVYDDVTPKVKRRIIEFHKKGI